MAAFPQSNASHHRFPRQGSAARRPPDLDTKFFKHVWVGPAYACYLSVPLAVLGGRRALFTDMHHFCAYVAAAYFCSS